MNLICKGCPSKCLEPKIQKNKKSVSKKKSKADLLEEKLTWWEKIFGPSPERFWPDPCTCRLVHREKKKIRMNDSRLCDPRYQMTAGDVFLYTEMTKQHRQPCLEPQPKPPPVYKIPKSALIRLINNLCDQPPITRIGIIPRSAKCKHSTELVEYRTPYAEMRPPQSTEKQLVCYKGILPQDVFPTTSGWKNLYQDSQKQPKKQYDLTKDFEHYEAEKCEMFKKHSRVEQLKMLVRKKNMCQCSKSW